MPIDAAILDIVIYPDPVLRAKAKPLKRVSMRFAASPKRMIELMREADGIAKCTAGGAVVADVCGRCAIRRRPIP